MDTMTKALTKAWDVANQAANRLSPPWPVVRIIPNSLTGLEANDGDSDFPAIRLLAGAATQTIQFIPLFGGHAVRILVSDNHDSFGNEMPTEDLDYEAVVHTLVRHSVNL